MRKKSKSADWETCRQTLDAGIRALAVRVSAPAKAQLIEYTQALAVWNDTYNLTAVRDPQAMMPRHLLDSLSVAPYINGKPLVDVGSGPGVPGLVLAIARPQLAVTLVEVNRKKAAFLRHIRRKLALANVTVIQERVEAWRPNAGFHQVICRAFSSAGECARLAGHLMVPDGYMLLMKGRHPGRELDDLPPDFRHVETVALDVPGLAAERHLAILARGLL